MTEQIHDVARIGHAELFTPTPDESLRFFVDVLGMEEEARDGQSVFLRGWGDYLRYSLKLTESGRAGIGHVALRTWSPEALERRVAAVEATGLGRGWIDGDVGHGPAYQFTDPDGHPYELYYEAERYVPPEHLKPSWKNQPMRYTGRGACVKRLDHINMLAAEVRPCREFLQDALGYRLYERIQLDDASEQGAWLSVSIAAHELIYVADHYGARGRLHHLAFWVDTREECLRAADLFVENDVYIEAAPSKHGVVQGFFLYGFEPGGNRIEVTTGGYFVFDPDYEPITWSADERARGQFWGVKTVESFHTYGTPDVAAGGDPPMTIDPQCEQLLAAMAEADAPLLTELTPEEARQPPVTFAQLIGPGPDVAVVRDTEIPGPVGGIPARVYEPVPEPAGTVVYYHGGGWVLGTLEDFDAVCRALAVASGARVVSVDYRLAPEHSFPAATDDAFAALVWVAEQHPQTPIVVAGDSAGGNLATVSALRAREAGGPDITLQVLVYPAVDCDLARPCYAEYADTKLILNAPEMVWFLNHYIPDEADREHPYASPLRAPSLAGLPPAYIVIAQHDPLREEGLEYAAALEAAGVPVTVRRYDDQIHAFFVLVNLLESADRAVAEAGAAIRDAVAANVAA